MRVYQNFNVGANSFADQRCKFGCLTLFLARHRTIEVTVTLFIPAALKGIGIEFQGCMA